MEDGKAPGPDGFIVNFFHHFWDLIKLEVWKIVENYRLSKKILPTFNVIFIINIPKSKGADTTDKFRP